MTRRVLIFFLFCCTGWKAFCQDTTQKIIAGRLNDKAQEKKPYIILISADGFRYDLADKDQAVNLIKLRNQGVAADYMLPCYPSLTFPNHYSIVTGLYPAHHGIVDNGFFDANKYRSYSMSKKATVLDSSWYGGTPLWVLAEKQHLLSASFYWVASESAIQGIRPTYYYNYSTAIAMNDRIQVVKNWLQLPEATRPHFITFYLPEVDHEEHAHGTGSAEAEKAVHFVDESIGKLTRAVDSLGLDVNYIFLSDHGMMDVDTANKLSLPAALDTTKFYISYGLTLLHLYAKNKASVPAAYRLLKKEAKDYDVYLTSATPARWHYSKKEDLFNRLGDIIVLPHPGKIFSSKKGGPLAEHGYDPALAKMHASFYAWGPAFKKHMKIKAFENIHVYPLIADILKLQITDKIDGSLKMLKPILRQQGSEKPY